MEQDCSKYPSGNRRITIELNNQIVQLQFAEPYIRIETDIFLFRIIPDKNISLNVSILMI